MKLIINKSLVNQINSGEKNISNMNKNEISQLQEIVTKLPMAQIITLTQKVLIPFVPIYQYDADHPYWFDKDTKFSSNIWEIKLGTWQRTINFNVTLNDGRSLTDKKHLLLLNSIKKWLVIQGNPFYCAGKHITSYSIKTKLLRVLRLTDALLLNADKIDLAGLHMKVVNSDLAMDILVNFSFGLSDGLFKFKKYLTAYLLENIPSVTANQVEEFIKLYPYVNQPLSIEEVDLELSQTQRIKACCFLYLNEFYSKSGSISDSGGINGSFFNQVFYKNTLSINISHIKIKHINMLGIRKKHIKTEYAAVPVRNSDTGISSRYLTCYLSVFKSLGVVNGKGFSEICPDTFTNINIKNIHAHSELKIDGRFTTLPIQVTFKALRNAFEFVFKYMNIILDTAYKVVSMKKFHIENKAMLLEFKTIGFMKFIPDSLKEIGVNEWAITGKDKNNFKLRRKNIGFCDLFDVLLGAIQIIIGVTMARRQAELLELNPIQCILPFNVDPNDRGAQNVDFKLIFDNRKSGSSGINPLRETLAKPILRSVAGLIYKLQIFNKKLIEGGYLNKNNATLFFGLNSSEVRFFTTASSTYNHHLNCFCDYFETETIQYNENDIRRYYIRQHQLRRFFVMLFFWSKGFDGLDTLRHFLGHTDCEHLYHYVTESIPGEVLTGIKAQRIVYGVNKKDIENIEQLTPIILDRFGAQSITFKTYRQICDDYEEDAAEGFIEMNPSFEQIKQQFEQDIFYLLTDHIIDLEPDFFIVEDKDGNKISDYKLILKVREI